MKERQLPFQPAMVRAVLRDIDPKNQTRRICKLEVRAGMSEPEWASLLRCCPYGQPGDRLWVREAWRTVAEADALPPRDLTPAHRIWYEADGLDQPGFGRYRPGMFMPRWASRILLEVTDVRVERLQDISEADAVAEGVEPVATHNRPGAIATHCGAYELLWEQINGPGSWDANPWVWVVSFKRLA
ncbi:hypothetical protein BN948_01789 [Hydrogenophaga intermedia]|uniref:Morphogenetic protein n=1 Tax=Hydrogenophaga intermedia TaxID=65786 RepID=A0A1L1PKA7_HYDIT|nr:hypothetical protein [Hydrogenophaga intermedia]CDN87367.1 hypothetical protein BN948_01789 [Hydrogenophaga intermedia]